MWPSAARARRALWGGADPRPGVSGSQPPGYEGLRAEVPLPARQAVLEALPQQKEGVCLRPASSSVLGLAFLFRASRPPRPPDGLLVAGPRAAPRRSWVAALRGRWALGSAAPILSHARAQSGRHTAEAGPSAAHRHGSEENSRGAAPGARPARSPAGPVCLRQPSARVPLSRRRSRGRRRVKTRVRVTETAGESWAASAWAARPLPSSLIHLLPPLLLTRGPQRESASPPEPWCLCPDGKLGGVSTHSRVVSRTPGPSAARPGGAAAGTTRCWREGRRGLRGVAGRARRGPAGRGRWEVSESTGFFLSYGARKSWAESRNFLCLHFWEIRAQPASRFLRAEGWIENSAPREGSACKPRRGEGVCLRPGLLHRRLCPWS